MKQQIALNVDCMEYMRTLPDKAFDLAIVDPPYGISIHDSGRLKKYNATETRWDDATPGDVYFSELKRCSKNQIIWGGNYYDLPPCRGFVIWDKKQPEDISFASCEFAWTSFDTSARTFYYSPLQEKGQRIHPTQKPVALYEWLLMVHGVWGCVNKIDPISGYRCSKCRRRVGFDLTPYCPNCGAKMDGGDSDATD